MPVTGSSWRSANAGASTVAVVWSDFRVNAGCFNYANSHRFSAFLRELWLEPGEGPPLLYVVNSAGVSLTHGRALFSDAFQLLPELLAYAREHLVVTCAVGKCLGLATLFYGLGHYRMAVTGHTHINLTGPEVIALFFGGKVDFERQAAAETLHDRNDLVHELVPSLEDAFERWKGFLAPQFLTRPATLDADPRPRQSWACSWMVHRRNSFRVGARACVCSWARRGGPIGVFINPLRQTNNLITVRALEKYAAGLDSSAPCVSIVSFLDSPAWIRGSSRAMRATSAGCSRWARNSSSIHTGPWVWWWGAASGAARCSASPGLRRTTDAGDARQCHRDDATRHHRPVVAPESAVAPAVARIGCTAGPGLRGPARGGHARRSHRPVRVAGGDRPVPRAVGRDAASAGLAGAAHGRQQFRAWRGRALRCRRRCAVRAVIAGTGFYVPGPPVTNEVDRPARPAHQAVLREPATSESKRGISPRAIRPRAISPPKRARARSHRAGSPHPRFAASSSPPFRGTTPRPRRAASSSATSASKTAPRSTSSARVPASCRRWTSARAAWRRAGDRRW
ncbi:MAG: hypothetical protein IPJ04_04795 [Candidatus Eisenbacteria bacterium]|nr:hypothetical protein [Candidatus Eisenbacteria bacterium]